MSKSIKQGPVIRHSEQLVVIVEQDLFFTGTIWKGCLEIERQTFQTYDDVAKCIRDTADCSIMKVFRVCMEDGKPEDITEEVVDAANRWKFSGHSERPVYNAAREHSTLSHRIQGIA